MRVMERREVERRGEEEQVPFGMELWREVI